LPWKPPQAVIIGGCEIGKFGHSVKLIPPAYVKPFVKRQKNDVPDAEAICDAARRPTMGEAKPHPPSAARQRPSFLAGIDAAMPQKESMRVLTRLAKDTHRRRTRPDQVTHRFMGFIRRPHGPHRNQRWRHHNALMA
jgi:transposase